MATVQVNSWAEFLDAVTVFGDTVVCPENAVWDLNDIAPEGVSALPSIYAASIIGNGTEIRNLHTTASFVCNGNINQSIEALHFINFISESASGLIDHNSSANGMTATYTGCKFSGILPVDAPYLLKPQSRNYKTAKMVRCAVAVDSAYTGAFSPCTNTATYCRIYVQLPNGTGVYQPNAKWCYLRYDCPAQTAINIASTTANSYDGDLPAVTSVSGTPTGYTNIFNADTIPLLTGTDMMQGVTTDQLKDPSYLSSIGFPIGVDA